MEIKKVYIMFVHYWGKEKRQQEAIKMYNPILRSGKKRV